MPRAAADFDFVRGEGFLQRLITSRKVIDESRADEVDLGEVAVGAYRILEHPRLPFISYPYEWSFPALQAAALLQLELNIEALAEDVMLSDASAYNVQFRGPHPIFIDSLSFRRYREGEFWLAHRQFCEQFLNPLLLRTLFGVPHNAWYRGALEGISTPELNRLLKLRHKLSWNVLTHVVLQSGLHSRKKARSRAVEQIRHRTLPRQALQQIFRGLRSWIASLKPGKNELSSWAGYERDNSYSEEEARIKADFVRDYATAVKPHVLWDIGCNTGRYAEVALRNGAGTAIGFDFDQGALEGAFARARERHLDLLPLYFDAANPSPDQGWGQRERAGMQRRANADGVLGLALVHHLVFSRNVPLEQVVNWLVDMAPSGIIEFVPIEDPMVRQLVALREDIFQDYNDQCFEAALSQRARIVKHLEVSASRRRLYWFERG